MSKPKIVALSASLRNARWGSGSRDLLNKIKKIKNKEALMEFVDLEAKIHLQQFIDAGRDKGIPFDELYKNLKKQSGGKGLCNSEVGMTVSLWSAFQLGCEIDYIPLGAYFTPNGVGRNLERLKEQLLTADGLLLCTPVYFGDRSSLASDLIEFIRADSDLREYVKGMPVAGIAVGAKRNGGQETTLIYQLMEMLSMGMLGLGNDSETTSQYGGTIHAGDIGTASEDMYGLNTSMGTGRRLARVMMELETAKHHELTDKIRVMFWVLQDKNHYAFNKANELASSLGGTIESKILELEGDVARCIACDICPIHVGPDDEYRCIITSQRDEFAQKHVDLLDWDVIVPVVYSPKDRQNLDTFYQRFIERTRYLRRGDYVLSDVLVMPLIYEEIGSGECLDIRMLTSFIRHQAIMVKPNTGYIYGKKVLNEADILSAWKFAIEQAKKITIGRVSLSEKSATAYRPVGYVLSSEFDSQASVKERHEILHKDREERRKSAALLRVK